MTFSHGEASKHMVLWLKSALIKLYCLCHVEIKLKHNWKKMSCGGILSTDRFKSKMRYLAPYMESRMLSVFGTKQFYDCRFVVQNPGVKGRWKLRRNGWNRFWLTNWIWFIRLTTNGNDLHSLAWMKMISLTVRFLKSKKTGEYSTT